MTGREEVVKTLAAVFFVQDEQWDDKNYLYWHTLSMWEDHFQAAGSLGDRRRDKRVRIVLRHLTVLNSGRVVWYDVKTVWENGRWTSDEHDPRCADPRYREYLKLKKEFEDEEHS